MSPPAADPGLASRLVALRVLVAVEHGGRSDRALDRCLRGAGLDDRDRRLATEIVYGTLRRQRALESALRPHCRRRFAHLDPEVRAALRMAAYQIACLDSVPGHAALDRTVEAVKRLRPQGAATVNAVVRAWLRAGARLPDPGRDVAARLQVPRWLLERFRARHGEAGEAWLAAAAAPPVQSVRVHPGGGAAAAVIAELAAEGVSAVPSRWAEGALVIREGTVIRTRAFREGRITPRSEASQLVTELLPAGGAEVLDACAGRGGKTIQIAESDPGRRVLGIDLDRRRLRDARQAAARTGRPGIRLAAADLARGVPVRGAFARILLDAPCSGLGTLRRHPEIRWRLTPRRLRRLATMQARLLASVAAVLAPGGYLLYVTCSTEPEENEQVVGGVLERVAGLRAVALAPAGAAAALVGLDGALRTWPAAPELDGFYAALLRREPAGAGPPP